jgi:hypothetical protein
MKCCVRECSEPAKARGLCSKHYDRLRLHGSTKSPLPTLPERFVASTDIRGPDECWPWIAAKKDDGYGVISMFGSQRVATHAALLIYRGEIVPPNLMVLHSCDNPACVNPAHLRLGTCTDNARDMHIRGRGHKSHRRGEAHQRAKLTEGDAREALRLIRAGHSQASIAAALGVNFRTISALATGTTWKHLNTPGERNA